MKFLKNSSLKQAREVKELTREGGIRKGYLVEAQNRYDLLGDQFEEDDPDQLWMRLSNSQCQASDVIPQKRKRRRGNKWITDEIFELMDQRRLLKDSNPNGYKEINKQIKRKCNIARERWLDQECAEIERLATRDTQ